MPDATPEFKKQLQDSLRQMEPGQTFEFRRTFTEGDLSNFCGVTGDYNPYHMDDGFAGESWYGRRTIPGLLTASMMTHIGGMLGFLATDMSFEFLAPVYPGDTITCTVTVDEKDEGKRHIRAHANFVNEGGVEVLRASFGGFPGRMRLAR